MTDETIPIFEILAPGELLVLNQIGNQVQYVVNVGGDAVVRTSRMEY